MPDQRRAGRHRVDLPVIAEHRQRGDLMLRIVNLSMHGFMVSGGPGLGKGERVIVRLPEIGRIEAFVIWHSGDRAGFQFERLIRAAEFARMIGALPAAPSPRGHG